MCDNIRTGFYYLDMITSFGSIFRSLDDDDDDEFTYVCIYILDIHI